ncbi:MAG: amidohydrolase [Kordiimonadaceae bacterium]|nr:amidohydrolase [Kordiimonadaceae bacterium]MBT7582859.1 amidohydrolase [Kordiimonadaceae bacterium]
MKISKVVLVIIGLNLFNPAYANTILINGKILAVDNNFSVAQAVAIDDGRFVAVGTNRDIRALATTDTTIIDLEGKTVVPGFIDGHAHMDREGLKFIPTSLDGARSIKDILKIIEADVKRKKPGEWIITMPMGDYPYYGVREDFLNEGRFPTRHDIDKVAPNNPVYIKGPWYYWTGIEPIISIANSAALKLAGITKDTAAPHPGMTIAKDENGEPNGIFEENGPIASLEHSLMKVVPRFSHNDRVSALKLSMKNYNVQGTTSVYEGHGLAPEVILAYQQLHENNELTVRSHVVISPTWDKGTMDDLLKSWTQTAGAKGSGDDFLKYSGIYAEVGGTPQDYIRRAQSDYSGWGGQSVDGALPPARGSLNDLVIAAAANDLRVNAITYSGPSLDQHVKAFELANKIAPIKDKRFVIEHLSFVSAENITNIKKLGLIPTMLPGSMVWLNGIGRTKDLTPELADQYVPLKTFVDNDIRFSIGTDNVPYNMLHSIGAAVTRLDATTGAVSSPNQKISRIDALKAATINGAYLSFEENIKGSIEIGKLADLVVLSKDYMTTPAEDIRNIGVLMTIVGGKVVYEK